MRNFFLISILLLVIPSCNKNKAKAGNSVELYLLTSFQPVPGKCKVDSSTAVLQTSPLISNEDILQYTSTTYQYKFSNSALEKVKQLVPRTPFAITVDKKVIFFGIYMPPILSSTCSNSITMTESWGDPSSIAMSLGYPSVTPGVGIDDQRNNPALIATFLNQGKLR